MTRPRRAIIATRVFEPEAAAAAVRLGALVRALRRRNVATTVLTTRSTGAPRSDGHVRRWPVLRDRSGHVRGYLQYASFDIPLLGRLLLRRRPDVVIAEPPPTTGLVTWLTSAVRRIPFVYFSADVTSSALESVDVNPVVARTVVAMERFVLRRAAAVLAVSDGVRDELLGLGVDEATITVVGTGIDTSVLTPVGDVQEPGYRYFIYAGTMSEFQGAEVFVRAFLRVAELDPDIRLLMFGGGVDREHLMRLAAPLGDRVAFPGIVSMARIARWTRGAVAGLASVRPDRGYGFAFPTKALASAACGTPVVFAGVGPTRALVAEQRLGWAVDWDEQAVATAMEAAMNRPRRLSDDEVRWLHEHYSLDAVAERAVDRIDEVVARDRGREDR